ncbi:MAG TPA: hypothetical protein VNL17_15365 [Verrucomicrobiae bacterium]|nr:hypothetical protein [Verrucomicrobiae bacterium]
MSRQYYQPGGNLPVSRTIAAILGSLLTAVLLGAGYGWAILYVPYAGHMAVFLVAVGFSGLLGVFTGYWLRWVLLRNRTLVVTGGAVVTMIAWYTGWVTWSWVLLRHADYSVKPWNVFFQPRVVWGVVRTINQDGLWTIDNSTPTGIVLWGIWLAEAIVIIGFALYIIVSMATDDPCCERCQCWCERSGGLKVALMDTAEFKRRLEAHDLGYILQFRPPPASAKEWLRLQLHSCPKCHELHTLTAKIVTDTPEVTKAGVVKTETFMNRLLVSSPVAKALRDIEAKWDTAESERV